MHGGFRICVAKFVPAGLDVTAHGEHGPCHITFDQVPQQLSVLLGGPHRATADLIDDVKGILGPQDLDEVQRFGKVGEVVDTPVETIVDSARGGTVVRTRRFLKLGCEIRNSAIFSQVTFRTALSTNCISSVILSLRISLEAPTSK